MTRILAGLAFLASAIAAAGAGAAELKVVSVEAMKPALQEVAPAFEKQSGHKLVIAFASDADVEKQVDTDDTIDVAIASKARIDKLVKSAKLLTFPKTLTQGASPEAVYAAGASMTTEQPVAVKALVDFLASAKAKEAYKAKGLQPS